MSFSKGMSAEDTRRNNEGVLSRCEEGDMLQFFRGTFSHWGVYDGHGKVIHRAGDADDGRSGFLSYPLSLLSFSGVRTGKAQVREDSFWDVAKDSLVRINNYKDQNGPVPPGSEIVERARSKLGEEGYNVLWKNCEHFATWCRYGKEQSQQAVVAGSVGTGLTVAGWAPGSVKLLVLSLSALFALPMFQSSKSSK
ncbi:PREDICTED: retinoic acid receptor responder protein 3-like [Branchiostoma belcheri]|uniref:Retinoic acid receptor responder protein 3-like n=1 Tax=Branchiostoma belcheri TaxID=7741 RepID=A0A6P5A761_BRABE|nr:PREDICTED: retinoic acid receptor responder protein 3-like [Branchiostoma belcheri]